VLQAIETLEKLLALEPDNLEGKALLAQALFRTGRAAEKQRAAQLLDEIEKTGKFPPEAWRVRGIMQYESGQHELALASFARAPKLEPIDLKRVADSYRRLAADAADTTRKNALYQSADSVYMSIMERDSASADAKQASFERARLRYLMKDYPGAVARLQRAIELDPNSGEAYYYLGLSKRALGDDAAGRTAIQKAVSINPRQAGWYIQLGAVHSKLKSVDEAKDAFEKAAELDDSTTVGAIARQQLGYYRLVAKDHAEAIRLLEKSAALDDKQWQTWLWLGQAYQNSGNIPKAVEAYRRVQALKPGEPNSLKQLKQLGK
jgi:tetratricopeptide (TPR) repeat protein